MLRPHLVNKNGCVMLLNQNYRCSKIIGRNILAWLGCVQRGPKILGPLFLTIGSAWLTDMCMMVSQSLLSLFLYETLSI